MHDPQLLHLIKMINQISANNCHHGAEDTAAEAVAAHLQKFWPRSMKAQIIDYAAQGGEELSPVSRLAVAYLGARQQKPS